MYIMRLQLSIIFLITALLSAACSTTAPAAPAAPTQPVAPPTATVSPLGQLGAPGLPAAPTATASPPRETVAVQRGPVVDEVRLSGRVVPVTQELAFNEDGILTAIRVEPGAKVKKGDVLAELDLGDLDGQLKQLKVIAEQDQIALQRAMQAGQLEVKRAELELAAARDALAKLRQPPTADDLAKARAVVQKAEANLATTRNNASEAKNTAQQTLTTAARQLAQAQEELARATAEYQRQPSDGARQAYDFARDKVRLAEDALAKAQIAYDTARNNEIAAVQAGEAEVASARADLDKLLRGPDQFAIEAAQRAVAAAQLALNGARQRAQPDPDLAKRVASGRLDVQRIEEQIAARRLYAPFDGEINGIKARPGAAVRATTPIMVILDNTRREIAATVTSARDDERARSRLIVGQPAQVTFSRLPGKTFNGVITRVPPAATAAEDRTFSISYDAAGAPLELGETADVLVTLGRADNTLFLPADAVRIARDRATVELKDGDMPKQVEVQVGIVTPQRVEILAGLKEGDVVYRGATQR
jgi:multidrug efflux pump subunit AcrA (membrane-fusion protein)